MKQLLDLLYSVQHGKAIDTTQTWLEFENTHQVKREKLKAEFFAYVSRKASK